MSLADLPTVASPWWVSAKVQLRRGLVISAWFWGMAILVVVVASVLTSRFTTVSWSYLGYGRQAVAWFAFSQAITLVAAGLRVHVGGGMTRRSFVRGALLAHLGLAAGHTAALVGLLQVERAVHAALGWPFVVRDGLDATGGRIGLLAADFGLSFLVAMLSGLLVGISYQRWAARWATLALPLTVGPLVVMLGLAQSGQVPPGVLDPTTVAPATAAQVVAAGAVGLGAALIAALAFWALSRTAPIRLPVS